MLGGEAIAMRDCLLEGAAMLSFEPLDERQAIFHVLQTLRRRIDSAGEVAERERQIVELRLDAVPRFEVRREPRIDRGELADPFPDAAEDDERRFLGVVKLGVTFPAQALDGVGAAQQLPLRAQCLVLAVLQVRFLQLAELECDQVETRRALAIVHAQAIELLAKSADVVEGRRDVGARGIEARPRVEQRQVLRRIEKLLMFVLAMQLDETIREIFERGRGGKRAVDERPASTLRRDLAANDQLAAVFGFEDRFDGREIFAGANEVLRRATTEQEPDGFDEDRFARAGLTCQDVERVFKIDGYRFDDRKVADG